MCGFVVIIQPNRLISKNLISAIDRDLFHRGPDSGGVYSKKGFSLIFRRLAILDLRPIADQPMIDYENGLSLVFNGEIYNYKELRLFLKKKGYFFRTNSDTEIILNGYKHWGEDVAKKLRGMFSFVIVDEKKKIAIASRDHFGIKPLYFFRNKKFIYLGSEIQPLKNLTELEIDRDNIGEIIFFRFSSGLKTGYKDVEKVEQGSTYLIKIEDLSLKKKKYFDLLDTIKPKKQVVSVSEKVHALLEDSAIRHTQSDVGFSVQLSGGLDSSLLVALLKKNVNKDIDTYSLTLDDDEKDESKYQKIVNKLYPTNHHAIYFDSIKFAESFENTIKSLESPTAHHGCILLFKLCEEISKKNKVVITGEGADELFGGYSRYHNVEKFLYLKKISKYIPDFFLDNIKKLNFLNHYKNSDPYIELMTFSKFDVLKEVFPNQFIDYDFRESILNRFANSLDKISAYDQTIYLESLLLRQDKISMAHSLEVRVPFVFLPLVKFVNSLNRKLKYDRKITKKILKQVSVKYFPNNFINREKNGLKLPIPRWLHNEKGFGRFLELFDSENANIFNFGEKKKIKNLISKFRSKKFDYLGHALAHMINIEIWMKNIKKNKV